MKPSIKTIGLLAALALGSASTLLAQVPDLTKDMKSVDRKGTYNLGATGMRGWIHTKAETKADADFGRTTGASRQILVTHVGANSPADGVMQVDDVILGIDDQPFTDDARKSIAWAIQEAEKSPVGGKEGNPKKTSSGSLVLLRWRAGKTESVALKMRVMGTYSDTAPYNCPKSAKIIEEACASLQKETNMWKEVNGLAMLATGDPRYMPQIKAIAQEVGPPTLQYNMPKIGMGVWRMGYLGIFLSEYYLQTGDKSVEPALNEVCVTLAKGQSMYGTFGHGISDRTKEGKFHGSIPPYGSVLENAAGANLAIVLGKRCGLKDPEIDSAVERANGFFGYYVDKGYLNYGEHEPCYSPDGGHANNGKGPIVTVMFGVQGDRIRETQYWSKMSVASYHNTQLGHCGQGLSYLWRMMGANMGGPLAAAAFFKEMSWHFDLARRCDGSFTYDGAEQFGPGSTEDNTYYGRSTWYGLSPTASHILSYAVPLKQLCITGKEAKTPAWLTKQEVADAIAAGRFEQDQKNLSVEELTKALGNWSPTVRCRAAWELVARPDTRSLVPQLITALEGPDAWLRKGACEALGQFKAPEALPVLIRLLHHEDRGLRWLAARALGNFEVDAVTPHVDSLLQAFISNAQPNDPIDWSDPLQFANGALSKTLFNGKINAATAKAPKDLLLPALRIAMQLPAGYARCHSTNFLRNQLTAEDTLALTSEIVDMATVLPPGDQMFRNRPAAMEHLAKNLLTEGISVALALQQVSCHGDSGEHNAGVSAIVKYGDAARWTLPALRQITANCAPDTFPIPPGSYFQQIVQTIDTISSAITAPAMISGLPVANPQVVATKAAKLITLKGVTPGNGPLTYAIVEEPAHGTLSGTPPSVTYTPADGYQGTDRFTFTVSSETTSRKLESPAGTVSLIVGEAGTGLRGEYVKDGKRIANRVDPAVDFDWSTLPAEEKIDSADVKIQWNGQVLAPETGTYVFSTLSAGGVRLWVNGIRVINEPRDRPPRWTDGAPVDLVEGQRYDVKLACYKKIPGPAMMKLKWTGPSFAGKNGVVVGQEWLFPNSPAGAAKPPLLAQLVKTANTQPLIITLTDGWDSNESPAWQITVPPQHGTLAGAAPTLTYTPAASFVGEDSFVYEFIGGKKQSTPTTIGIIVTAAPPAAAAAPAVADPIPADFASVGPGASVEIKKDADITGGTLVLKGGTLNLQGVLSAASTLVLAADTVSTIDSSAKGGAAGVGYTTIRGGGGLILSGTCDITFLAPNSTYLGNTRIALAGGKRLLVAGDQPFGTVGRVTFAGQGGPVAMSIASSNSAAIPNDIHLESSVVYSQTYNNLTLKLPGNISGPGGLTKTFDDKDRGTRLLLLGRNNSFSGGIDFRSGHLLVMKNSMGSGPVTLGGKATTEHAVALMNMIPMEVHNPITLIGIPDGATPQPAAMTEFHVASRLEIAGTLAGTGGLLKSGSGVMVLSGVSSFTGPTVVQAGTLAIARTAAFGRGSIEIAAGAKLHLDYAGNQRLPALRVAGKDLPAGTYGGKDSTATSKMPDHFTGPGMVTIGDAATIPRNQSTSRKEP
jgi:autotransporter-associated beta strand protein